MKNIYFKEWCLILAVMFCLALGCGGQTATLPGGATGAVQTQDSPRVIAYKTLATAAKTYDATMKSLNDLYRQKIINDQVKAKAIEYGKAFRTAYNLAIDAVEAGGNYDLATMGKTLADLLAFVQPYLVKTQGGK